MVSFALLDTGVCLLQTTTSSGAKMAVLIFPQQSPIYGWTLASNIGEGGGNSSVIKSSY
ncbi:MAG: hypothetical protein ACJAUP_000943 [Cellvibrionaceae bacterium]|jgi:hypothetical protein